jgi:hypothetical protein
MDSLKEVASISTKVPEKTSRDIFLSGVAGLLGGPLGVPMSVGVYLLWRKLGLKGSLRWWIWAATGIVGVPLSLAITQVVMHPERQSSVSSTSAVSQLARPGQAPGQAQEDVKVGELQTDNFRYANVRISPYTIKNSFAAQQANVSGKLYEITADVTNLSKESKAPQLFNIEVTDAQGRTFKEADAMVRFGDLEKGHRATDYVLPGQTRQDVRLTMIDASPDATDFSLKVSAGVFDGSKVVKPIQSSSAAPENVKSASQPSAASESEQLSPPARPRLRSESTQVSSRSSEPTESSKPSPQPKISQSDESKAEPSPSGFNAEIFSPPTNCRSGPGKDNSVVKVFSRGDVLVDQKGSQTDTQGSAWFKELYANCWVHESQLKFK